MRFDPAKRTFIAANQIKSAEIDNYSSSLLSAADNYHRQHHHYNGRWNGERRRKKL
jgi:hypothetical protein